ncbi:MAG: lysylphosphatidylglycerol synthase domain-containing protein [Ardenticatenaceae bacterium]
MSIKSDERGQKRQLKHLLAWPFVLLVCYFWWQSINKLSLADSLGQAAGNEAWIGLALLAAGLYLIGQAVIWLRIVREGTNGASDVMVRIPWRIGLRAWMLSNMGRYLPGSVWHLVGRVVMGEAAGLSRTSGALGVLLEQSLQLLSALLIVGLSLPFWPEGSFVRGYSWLAWLVPLGLVVIHPRLFFPLLNTVLSRLGRDPIPVTLSYSTMLRYTLYYLLDHLANGLSLAFAVLALQAPVAVMPAVVGGALFAWTVGYLTILAPGGLGVREFLVTQALGPIIGPETAAVGGLLWRAANILTEALGALIFELLWRISRDK